MKIQLKKPFQFRDQIFESFELELENFTGQALLDVESQFMKTGANTIPELSREYWLGIAARALKIPVEALKMLNARDLIQLTNEIRAFFLVSDSSAEENAQTETTVQAIS